MSKILAKQKEVNRKDKAIERLKAKDGVKYSNKLEKEVKGLRISLEAEQSRYINSQKDLAKCIKEKRKLEDAKE